MATAEFNKEWESEKTLWEIHAERWGDFLALSIGRRHKSWDDINKCYRFAQEKSHSSIRLDPGIVIRTSTGHAPDLTGRQMFSWRWSGYDNDSKRVLMFNGVSLPNENDTSGGWYSSGEDYTVPILVDGLARPQEMDKIIFGSGGGSQWSDMMSSLSGGGSSLSYSADQEIAWKRQRDGATIPIPATLGDAAYQTILQAMKP